MKELTFTEALNVEALDREFGIGKAMDYLETLGFEILIWKGFEKQYKEMKELHVSRLYEMAREIQEIQYEVLGIDEVMEQASSYYECAEY